MRDFRQLAVWKVSHDLTLKVYASSRRFPREEVFGLVSQMRRSAASIPYNISEGCGLGTNAAFANSLQIAYGSSSELDYQLQLALDLGYLPNPAYQSLSAHLQQLQKMLWSLLSKVRRAS